MLRAPIDLERLRAALADGRVRGGSAVELVAGVLLLAPPPSVAVVATVTELAAALDRALPDHRVAVREAVAVGEHDLLRPEVALLRPLWGRGGASAGAPADAPAGAPTGGAGFLPATALDLAVFVGDGEAPLRWRAQRCARAGVPEAWTVAVGEGAASRWRWPLDGRYRRRDPLPAGAVVAPDAAPEARVRVWRGWRWA